MSTCHFPLPAWKTRPIPFRRNIHRKIALTFHKSLTICSGFSTAHGRGRAKKNLPTGPTFFLLSSQAPGHIILSGNFCPRPLLLRTHDDTLNGTRATDGRTAKGRAQKNAKRERLALEQKVRRPRTPEPRTEMLPYFDRLLTRMSALAAGTKRNEPPVGTPNHFHTIPHGHASTTFRRNSRAVDSGQPRDLFFCKCSGDDTKEFCGLCAICDVQDCVRLTYQTRKTQQAPHTPSHCRFTAI